MRPEFFGGGQAGGFDLLETNRLGPHGLELGVGFLDADGEFLTENFRLHQVRQPQAGAGDLVPVGRPNAPPGGADLVLALGLLLCRVQRPVVGHDQVGAIADEQVRADFDADRAQPFDFAHERNRVEHDAVADDALFAGPQDARRDEVEDVFLAARDHGMAGIIAALGAHHDIRGLGQDVDDLAFAFIAPLRTH